MSPGNFGLLYWMHALRLGTGYEASAFTPVLCLLKRYKLFFIYFHFVFAIWVPFDGAQDLLLFLPSGIAPGSLREKHGRPGFKPGLLCAREMPYLLCYRSSPLRYNFKYVILALQFTIL